MKTAQDIPAHEWAQFTRARATVEWTALAPVSQAVLLNAIEARRVAFYVELDPERTTCAECDADMSEVFQDDGQSDAVFCLSCTQDRAEQGQADRVMLRAEIDRLCDEAHTERNAAAALATNVMALLLDMDRGAPLDPELVADLRKCVNFPTPEKK